MARAISRWLASAVADTLRSPEIAILDPSGAPIAAGAGYSSAGGTEGVAAVHAWTVQNTGSDVLTCSVAISGQSNCTATITQALTATIGAGGSDTYEVTVTPTAGGAWAYTATVSSDDADESTHANEATGTAVADFALTRSIQFGGTDEHANTAANIPAGMRVNKTNGFTMLLRYKGTSAGYYLNIGNDGIYSGANGVHLANEAGQFRVQASTAATNRLIVFVTAANFASRLDGNWHTILVDSDGTFAGTTIRNNGSALTTFNSDNDFTTDIPSATYDGWVANLGSDVSEGNLLTGNIADLAIWATTRLPSGEWATAEANGTDLRTLTTPPSFWVSPGNHASDDATSGTGGIYDLITDAKIFTPRNTESGDLVTDYPA